MIGPELHRINDNAIVIQDGFQFLKLPFEIFVSRQTVDGIPFAGRVSLIAELAHRTLAGALGLARTTAFACAQDGFFLSFSHCCLLLTDCYFGSSPWMLPESLTDLFV